MKKPPVCTQNRTATGEPTNERRTNEKLRIDMAEAKRDANRARVDASSLQQKLRETETAFTEAKKQFISAPDLVSSLQSLTEEVKTIQEDLNKTFDKTTEAVALRPEEERRNSRTLQQMKRVLHDLGRYPRRRRTKADVTGEDGARNMKRGRICYICRCKGHLAKDCPRAQNPDTVESAQATTSDTEQHRMENPPETREEQTLRFTSMFRPMFRMFNSGD